MQRAMNESMITFGCVMAKVFDIKSKKAKANPQDEVVFSFCHTADSESSDLIFTPEMRELIYRGYFMVAVARFSRTIPGEFSLRPFGHLSGRIRSAFAKTVPELVSFA